jgi:hypothetical protein
MGPGSAPRGVERGPLLLFGRCWLSTTGTRIGQGKREKMKTIVLIIFSILMITGCGNKKIQEQSDSKANITTLDNFDLGEQLNKSGNWQASNEALLKDYKEQEGKVSMTCFYLFLNYGMLGNSKEAKKYLDDAFARDILTDELKESKNDKKYEKVFTDKVLKPVIENYLKMGSSSTNP